MHLDHYAFSSLTDCFIFSEINIQVLVLDIGLHSWTVTISPIDASLFSSWAWTLVALLILESYIFLPDLEEGIEKITTIVTINRVSAAIIARTMITLFAIVNSLYHTYL